MVPGNRHSLLVETGGQPVEPIGPVHVMLDVLLARPDDLDWTVALFGDLDGANDAVALEPAAKPTADKVIVDHDLVRWQARGFRCGRLDACNGLAADPDFAGVLANMHRAVHRLHRYMREKRELVGCIDLGDGACQGFVDIADVLSHRP